MEVQEVLGGGYAVITLCDGTTVTEYKAVTALELEARRQGKSYEKLVADTPRWEQEQIVLRYLNKKLSGVRRKCRPIGKTCEDCALWVRDPATRAGGYCPVPVRAKHARKALKEPRKNPKHGSDDRATGISSARARLNSAQPLDGAVQNLSEKDTQTGKNALVCILQKGSHER